VKGYSFELWWGILAPPKTPPEIVNASTPTVNRIVATPEMREVFLREGAEPAPMTAPQFAQTDQRRDRGLEEGGEGRDIKPE
jgi:tripartite-type tricarboxylate transporter receptor subunit TctC